jgi:hypothetical protein
MRLEIDEICSIIKDHFEDVLPEKLAFKGMSTIEDYLDTPPTEPNNRQLCVYMSDGSDTSDYREDGVIIQLYLPGETQAHKWTSTIFPFIRAVDPLLVGHVTKSVSYIGFFPGESEEGGGGVIIYFEMKFSSRTDSCDN